MYQILPTSPKPNGYYVYVILNPTTPEFNKGGVVLPHMPFYLGKGKNKRVFDHIREAKLDTANKKCNIHKISAIRQILSIDAEPIHIILAENLSSEDALQYEGKMGDIIGYRFDNTGPLTNKIKTGIKNPILPGERNPFYGKHHSEETKKKIVATYKNWHDTLPEFQKIIINEKRSLAMRGKKPSEEQILKRLKAKYGEGFEIGKNEKTLDKISQRKCSEDNRAKRIFDKEKRIFEIKEKKNNGTYWQEVKGGKNNPMYGKGEKLLGSKNGRAKKYIVSIAQYIFLVNGNLKLFQKAFMERFQCPNPLRSHKMENKYLINMYETEVIPENVIIFTDILSLQHLGDLICKN